MAITTITTTAAEDARMVVAFGARLSLGRNATAAEIKADLRRYAAQVVREEEIVAARRAAVATLQPDIAPT